MLKSTFSDVCSEAPVQRRVAVDERFWFLVMTAAPASVTSEVHQQRDGMTTKDMTILVVL